MRDRALRARGPALTGEQRRAALIEQHHDSRAHARAADIEACHRTDAPIRVEELEADPARRRNSRGRADFRPCGAWSRRAIDDDGSARRTAYSAVWRERGGDSVFASRSQLAGHPERDRQLELRRVDYAADGGLGKFSERDDGALAMARRERLQQVLQTAARITHPVAWLDSVSAEALR